MKVEWYDMILNPKKIRFTIEPYKKEGWCLLKRNDDEYEIGQALGPYDQLWSLCTRPELVSWEQLKAEGYRRSIRLILEG